jgi:hypothetical protein
MTLQRKRKEARMVNKGGFAVQRLFTLAPALAALSTHCRHLKRLDSTDTVEVSWQTATFTFDAISILSLLFALSKCARQHIPIFVFVGAGGTFNRAH